MDIVGWTVADLARESKVSPANLYRLCDGKRRDPDTAELHAVRPRWDTIEQIASAFHVSATEVHDLQLTDLELHTRVSRGALRAARGPGYPDSLLAQFNAIADDPGAPVTPDTWRTFIRLSTGSRDAEAERSRMQIPPVPPGQLRLRFPRHRR